MRIPRSFSEMLFVLAVAAILIVTSLRLWPLRVLYLDATARDGVRGVLEDLSAWNGWLLSDLSVESVAADSVTVVHREHRKNPSMPECLVVSFNSPVPLPCGR
jgi:hypothetical protein